MTSTRPWFALLLLAMGTACSKGDKVPSYLEIPAVEVTTTVLQGAPTSRITDVWVSVNDELLGAWELPARIPALYEGTVEVRVVPAIKRNGMYDDRLRYPFMDPYIASVELSKNATTTISPTVTYIDAASFWIESFDDPGTLLNLAPASDTLLLRFTPAEHPDIVLDDTPSGGFVLDEEHRYIRVFSDEDFEVFGGPIFLELDYRSDIQFTVGVQYVFGGIPTASPYVFVAPTSNSSGGTVWNKIHIDLSPVFNTAISQRDIFIEATLPEGRSSASVYLENIKLVRIAP
ncbi:MAG: hypothetical protein WEC15_07725 [Flavobacteriales bacterium]